MSKLNKPAFALISLVGLVSPATADTVLISQRIPVPANGAGQLNAGTDSFIVTIPGVYAGNGGAVNIGSNAAFSSIGNITYQGNQTSGATGNGGAIYLDTGATLDFSSNAITFLNNKAARGGGVYSVGNLNIGENFLSLLLQGNTATGATTNSHGGALYAGGDILVDSASQGNISFINNISTGNGGAIYAGGTITINGSYEQLVVSGNKSTNAATTIYTGGGAFYAGKDIVIDGSFGGILFDNNSTSSKAVKNGGGGALYAKENIVIHNSSPLGGSLTITNNSSDASAGAIQGENSITISGNYTDILVENNNNITGGGYGAIRTQKTAGILIDTITAGSMIMRNNTTWGYGAAMDASEVGKISVLGSYGSISLTGNTALNLSGGAWGAYDYILFDTHTAGLLEISSNQAKNSGGAIYSYASTFVLSGHYGSILVDSNFVTGGSGNGPNGGAGGAFYSALGMTIDPAVDGDFVLSNNLSAAAAGGALYSGGTLTFSPAADTISVTGNQAKTTGGAFQAATDILIRAVAVGDMTFSNNQAVSNGGALYAGKNIVIDGSYGNFLVNANTSTGTTGFGGALYSGAGNISINAMIDGRLEFRGNASGYGGGAIYAGSTAAGTGLFSIDGSYGEIIFASNNTTGTASDNSRGGAVFANSIRFEDTLQSGSLTIENNSAGRGQGGAFTANGSSLYLGGQYGTIRIAGNATGAVGAGTVNNGGAFYAGTTLTFNAAATDGLTIERNTAYSNGGAFYAGNALSITGNYGSILVDTNRTTASNGGAFYSGSTTYFAPTVDTGSIVVTNNTAGNRGGAFYSGNAFTLTLATGDVLTASGNKASSNANGGFLYTNTGSMTFDIGADALATIGDADSIANNADSISTTGATPLNKTGLGDLVLWGANTYTGATNVNAGKLLVNGSLSTGAVTVANGATLGGSGAIAGATTVASGGTITAGDIGTSGKLSTANVTLASGSVTEFDLGASDTWGGANDWIASSGKITASNGATIRITSSGMGSGLYHLMNYADGTAATFNALKAVQWSLDLSQAGGMDASRVYVQTTAQKEINLVYVDGDVNYWDGSNSVNNSVIGGGSGTWQAWGTGSVYGNDGWTSADGTRNAPWQAYNQAVFANTGGTVTVDNSKGQVKMSGATFTVGGYTIAGNDIVLGGTSKAIMDARAGTTTISAKLIDDATPVGSVTKTGAGTLTLSAGNTYTGATIVDAGTLALSTTANAIASSNAVTVNGGATLQLLGGVAQQINHLSGAGDVNLGSSTLTANNASDTTFSGTLNGAGRLAKTGSGTLTLDGSGSSIGGVSVNSGTLAFDQSGIFTVTGNYTTAVSATTMVDSSAGLKVSGIFTQSSGSTLDIAPGTLNPVINTTTASIAGTLNLSGASVTAPASASALSENPYTVIHTAAPGGITGDFSLVTIGGAVNPVDYLLLSAGKSANNQDYNVSMALSWFGGPTQGHGTFTLVGASEAFNVDIVLPDQAPSSVPWDGRSLTKAGAGTLTLSAANTYTGTTTVSGGTLALGPTSNVIASSSTVVVDSGATLQLLGSTAQQVNNLSGAGSVNLGSSMLTVNNTVNTSLSGALNGLNSGGLVKTGSGEFDLTSADVQVSTNAANARSVSVIGGKLDLADADIGARGNFARALAASGSGSTLTVSNSTATTTGNTAHAASSENQGRIELNGVALSTTGDSSWALVDSGNATSLVSRSTLATQGANAGGISISGGPNALVTLDDSLIHTRGANAYGIQTSAGGTPNDGSRALMVDATGSSIVTEGSKAHGIYMYGGMTEVRMDGGSIATSGEGAVGAYALHASTIDLQNLAINTSGTDAYGLWVAAESNHPYFPYQVLISGTNLAIHTTGDRATGALVSASTFGGTNANAGKLVLDNSSILTEGNAAHGVHVRHGATDVTIANTTVETRGASASALLIEGVGSDIRVDAGTAVITSGNHAHGISLIAGAQKTFDGSAGNMLPDITVSGSGSAALHASGSGSLLAVGGVLALDMASTASADTYGAMAENSGDIVFAGNASSGGTRLDANHAGILRIRDGGDAAGSRVSLSTGGQLDASGAASGTRIGSLEGDATAEVVLGTANLVIGSNNVANNGSLLFDSTFSGVISGQGSLTKQGAGKLTLTGENTYTGGTTISAGTLQIGDGGATGSIAGNIQDDATLVFNRANDLVYAGVISGAGTLAKLGSGTLTLTKSNSYAGGTLLESGRIVITSEQALGTGSVSIADATTLYITPGAGNSFTFNNALTHPGGSTGSGTLKVDMPGAASLNSFDFGAGVGSGFFGIVELNNSTFTLDGDNTTALTHATLQMNADNHTIVGTGAQTIGNLVFNGGNATFNAILPNPATGTISTRNIHFASGSVQLTLTAYSPSIPSALPLLQQDDNVIIDLVRSQTVSGDVRDITLIDQSGIAIRPDQRQDILDAGGEPVATGSYGYALGAFDNKTGNKGLFVKYSLEEIDILDGKTLSLSGDNATVPGGSEMLAWITGGGNLAIDANESITLDNRHNDYSGTTTVISGTLILGSDNALGNTSELAINADATADINGKIQTIGALYGAPGSTLNLDGGKLTISGGGIASGTLSGSGMLNLDGGTLYVNGNSPAFDATTTVAAAAVLSGYGHYGSPTSQVINQGTLLAWNVTSPGQATDWWLGGLLVNNGLISLAGNVAGNTLTVGGNYAGGGRLEINTLLGGDNSLTDRLIVQGGTSGTTSLHVNNLGGAGARTDNGIRVVEVAGQSGGVFVNEGRMVAGAYEYDLYRGTPENDDGNWYLRAIRADGESEPSLRPESHLYVRNQAAARDMFLHTLRDRSGNASGDDNRNSSNGQTFGWVRLATHHVDSQSARGQVGMDTETSLIHFGGDLIRRYDSDNNRYHVGLMGAYGKADTSAVAKDVPFTNNGLRRKASGGTEGYGLGAYGTWYGNISSQEGPYVDLWAQYGWYKNTIKANALPIEEYDSRSWTVSMEGGYALIARDSEARRWIVEPQAQIAYSAYKEKTHIEANGTRIDGGNANGFITRLGIRLHGRAKQEYAVQPFLEANWWYGAAPNALEFNGQKIDDGVPNSRYELKVGLQGELSKAWQVWGHLEGQSGSGDYRRYGGMLGARLLF